MIGRCCGGWLKRSDEMEGRASVSLADLTACKCVSSILHAGRMGSSVC